MAYRQYIGSRYVPIFGRKGEDTYEWDGGLAPYEPLTVVMHQGNSFTSVQYVPTGIDINNRKYWAETGNWNAQVEAYRQEVRTFDRRISDNTSTIAENTDAIADNSEAITAEVGRATAAETANAEAITAESTRATAAERTNAEAIAAETTRATAAETANTNAIAAEVTRSTAADERFQKEFDNTYKDINFKCVDRFIVGDFSDYVGGQAACVFEQDNTVYWAQIILSENTAQDVLVIRNVYSNLTVSRTTLPLSHGYSMSYNASKRQLVTSDAEHSQLLFISTANLNNPTIVKTMSVSFLSGLTTDYMFTWVGDDIAAIEWLSKHVTEFSTNGNQLDSYFLDFDNSPVPQNINYNEDTDEYYIGMSSPNCISVISRETHEQVNSVQLRQYYAWIYMRELESAIRVGDKIYVNDFENVDGLLVLTLLETDVVRGTIGTNHLPYIQPTGNIGNVINYDTGSLIPTSSNTKFKLAGDAIKLAQSVSAYGRIFLNFETDYPHIIAIAGAEIGINRSPDASGKITIHGIEVNSGALNILDSNIAFDASLDNTSGGTVYSSGIRASYSDVYFIAPKPDINDNGNGVAVLLYSYYGNVNALRFDANTNCPMALISSNVQALNSTCIDAKVNYRNILSYVNS